jgi:hypothetical protein
MPGLQLQYYTELRPPFPCKVLSEWEPADRKSAALWGLILKVLLSALVAFPTSIKLKSMLLSTSNQLTRICRIPDVISVADEDGLRHALASYMFVKLFS